MLRASRGLEARLQLLTTRRPRTNDRVVDLAEPCLAPHNHAGFLAAIVRGARATQAIEKEDAVAPETPWARADCRNPLCPLEAFPTELDNFRNAPHRIQRTVTG